MNIKGNRKAKEPILPEIILPDKHSGLFLNLYTSQIPAGFPSPAEDFMEKRLDLNDHLIGNPTATFLVRVKGNSMVNAGIFDGDLLIIDRSIEAEDGKIILGVLNGEFTIKRISKKGKYQEWHYDKSFTCLNPFCGRRQNPLRNSTRICKFSSMT